MTNVMRIPKIKFKPVTRQIHGEPCKQCPSMYGPDDKESRDYRKAYKAGKLTVWDVTFNCAWRPEKRCYGVCFKNGITEKDFIGEPHGVFQ